MRFLERVRALKAVLWVMFLVGFVLAIPSAVIPMLQAETFNNSYFLTTGILAGVKGLLGFVYLPLMGSFSDLYGRKNAIVLLMALSVIPYALMLIAGFWVYSISNVFLGLYDATLTLMLTLTSDVVPASAGVRTESFSLVMASFFLGVSTGPFIGAFLSTNATFIACAAGQLVAVVMALWMLPSGRSQKVQSQKEVEREKLASEDRGETDINKCPFLKVVVADAAESEPKDEPDADTSATDVGLQEVVQPTVQPLTPATSPFRRVIAVVRQYADLRVVVFLVFWNSLTEQMFDKMLLLYLQTTLNFTSTQQAVVMAILGVGGLLCLLIVTPWLKHFFGTLAALRIGMVFNVVVSLAYAFANRQWEALAATTLIIGGMGVFPCAAALASTSVDEQAVGVAQGLAASARIIASGLSPALYGYLFQVTQNTELPGASFLLAAACVVVSLASTKLFSARVSEARHH